MRPQWSRRRTVVMVPLGAATAFLLLSSTAWACGVLIGTISVHGNYPPSPIAVMNAGGSGHFASDSQAIVAAQSCFIANHPSCPPGSSYVDVRTGGYLKNGSTYRLPASSSTANNCPASGLRCTFGDALNDLDDGPLPTGGFDVPPVTVTDEGNNSPGAGDQIGSYLVNLVVFQWVDWQSCALSSPPGRPCAIGPDGNFDGGTGSSWAPWVARPGNGDRVSAMAATDCSSGGDQTARVVHLGLAIIDGAGAISNATRPLVTPDRAQFDQYTPMTPQPAPIGGGTWRFYFPFSPATTISSAAPGLLASSVCVVDRYGMNSIEAPLQLMFL